MINLLPPEVKENILYARRNTMLLRWLVALAIGIAGVMAVIGFGYLYLSQTTKNTSHQAEMLREDLERQKLAETQKQVTDIGSDLDTAVQVLSRRILFSDLIKRIGTISPPGTVLTRLNLSEIDGAIELRFLATDYLAASKLHVNLQNPENRIFQRAEPTLVQCGAESSGDNSGDYPCSTNIKALFGDNSPYLFINKGADPL